MKTDVLLKELNDMGIYPQETTVDRSMRKEPERFKRVDTKKWTLVRKQEEI